MKTSLAASATSFSLSLLLLAIPSSSGADNLFVSAGGSIEEINSAGTVTVFASSGLDDPEGLAFDSSGNLYVANYGNSTIMKFSASGGVLSSNGTVFASGGEMYGPVGLAFDGSGNLYVANNENDTIEKFNSSGGGGPFANTWTEGPEGLAIDSAGNVYVAIPYASNYGNNTIEVFNPLGVDGAVADWAYPYGLAFDSKGNLYVDSSNDGNILNLSKGTRVASGLDFPIGLAFDSGGNLYVANSGNGTIDEFNTNGVETVFASGLSSPQFIAIQVPEPATWALLVLGVAALLGNRPLRRYIS